MKSKIGPYTQYPCANVQPSVRSNKRPNALHKGWMNPTGCFYTLYCGWMYNQCAAQWVARCTTPKWSYIDFANGDPMVLKVLVLIYHFWTSSNPDPKFFYLCAFWASVIMKSKPGPICDQKSGLKNGPMPGPICGPKSGLKNVPMRGPICGPMSGLKNVPMCGPMRGPTCGPMCGPISGLNCGPMFPCLLTQVKEKCSVSSPIDGEISIHCDKISKPLIYIFKIQEHFYFFPILPRQEGDAWKCTYTSDPICMHA